ncbi:MAG: WD40 repeat domain-containing protein [Dermatophilaceae bacterium]|nr:WD40 repeat domain-containing protein [Intrasporangiaceae bacterium]
MLSDVILRVGGGGTPPEESERLFFNDGFMYNLDTREFETGWDAVDGRGRWSPDGSRLAVWFNTSPKFNVVDVATKTLETGWPEITTGSVVGYINDLAWSPNGTRIALALRDIEPYFRVINTSTKGYESGWPVIDRECTNVAWSPDGSRLVVLHEYSPYMRVINTSTKTIESGWPSGLFQPRSLATDPLGSRFAVAAQSVNDSFAVFDFSTKSRDTSWPAVVSGNSSAVAWSVDGSLLAVQAYENPVLRVYDTTTKERVISRNHSAGVYGHLAFSAGSRFLLFGYRDYLYWINLSTKNDDLTWPAQGGSVIRSPAFSPLPANSPWVGTGNSHEGG